MMDFRSLNILKYLTLNNHTESLITKVELTVNTKAGPSVVKFVTSLVKRSVGSLGINSAYFLPLSKN